LKQIIFRLTIHSATIHLDANCITLIEAKYFLLNDFAAIHFAANCIALIEPKYFLLNHFVLIFQRKIRKEYLQQRYATLRWLEVRNRSIFGLTKT
jgi:hypothetical protein